ncbi:transporter [Geobacter sp. AOG2]|uniref:SphA family protein n=1 Tax=Geobacter sp. AOG2 TaxID=1566347 RepID=UPI001CC66558|nr:transporter [Geobacter sp. AOG2]GFE59626.1 hypothetical protein AOG2_02140 [Geobacter sp. AOG2]
MKNLVINISIALTILLSNTGLVFASSLMAQPMGHYNIGPNAINGAMNPPGDYFLIALPYYTFDKSTKNSGDLTPGPDFNAAVVTLRYIHMFKQGLLGGTTGFNVAATAAYTATKFNGSAPLKDEYTMSIGDPSIEFMQGWMFDKFAISTRAGLFAGIGNYSKARASNYAKDFWSFDFQLRGTYWLDKNRDLSLSLMETYETSTKMSSYDIKPGDNLTTEAGFGYQLTPNFNLGGTVYNVQQITKDSGSDVGWNKDNLYGATGIGPASRIMLPFIKPGAFVNILWWHDIEARNHAKGDMVFTEFAIPF